MMYASLLLLAALQSPPLIPISGVGEFPFDNTQAPTLANPTYCPFSAGISGSTGYFYHEVWYEWTAPDSGGYIVRLSAPIDGMIGVWEPDGSLVNCADTVGWDDDVAEFVAVEGNSYVIRTGGWFNTSQGTGTLGVHEEPQGIPYCDANPNSTGQSAEISYYDSALHVANAPPGEPGIFFYGPLPTSVPFGAGVRCVGGSVTRLYPPVFIDGQGEAYRAHDRVHGMFYQFWFRDSGGFNLSNGLSL